MQVTCNAGVSGNESKAGYIQTAGGGGGGSAQADTTGVDGGSGGGGHAQQELQEMEHLQ